MRLDLRTVAANSFRVGVRIIPLTVCLRDSMGNSLDPNKSLTFAESALELYQLQVYPTSKLPHSRTMDGTKSPSVSTRLVYNGHVRCNVTQAYISIIVAVL